MENRTYAADESMDFLNLKSQIFQSDSSTKTSYYIDFMMCASR